MKPLLSPEHVQLLSDQELDRVASSRESEDPKERGAIRLARYEQRRRRCEVPVEKRYEGA